MINKCRKIITHFVIFMGLTGLTSSCASIEPAPEWHTGEERPVNKDINWSNENNG